MAQTQPKVASIIHEGRSISSSWNGMTDADRRWLAGELKAGRVYRLSGLRDGFRLFANTTYWISANRAADLDAECASAAANLCHAAAVDEMVRGNFAGAQRLVELA